MVVSGSQNVAIKQYTQAVQNSAAAAAEEAAKATDSTGTAAKATSKDVDTVEISKAADMNKMSDSERASLVESLKTDLDNQMTRFTDMMLQTFQQQGITANLSNGNDFWKMVAGGNYTVSAQTKADAQAAISENGYWGVSQTSQRIFDFAKAIAGDDVEKMKEYQKAVEKGFAQAGDAWGGSLPAISGQTKSATDKLFADYFAQNS